jgi:hypothetical protein
VAAGRLARVLPTRRHARRRRAPRRRVLLALAIVVLILAGGAGATAFAYTSLKGQAAQLQAQLTAHLQAGQSELEAAKASLKQANANHDEALVAQAKAHFTAAKGQFTAAGQIADSSQLLRRLEILPAVGGLAGSRHNAVDGIAGMGVAISDAGQELADLAGQLIKPAAAGGQQGRTLLTVLDQTDRSLVKVRSDFDRAQKAAAQVDVQVLSAGQQATFVKARDTISSALAAIDEFERLVPVLTDVLGGNGTRTYLIEQVNPAELRAGGGFIGTYSVLRADKGTLKLVRSGDAAPLAKPRPRAGQPGYIAAPGPIRELTGDYSWTFLDSNFFPDFPSNARAAERLAQPRLGTKFDGVISIDYYTVAKMLELTGPLAVPGYRLTVDANNFIPQIVLHDLAEDVVHKAILSAIAGPLMERVSNLPPEQWPALLGALNGLASGRHLQAYFNNQTVETEMDRFGWSGGLNPTGSQDFMVEVESNFGANKVNYFVTRHYTVVLTRKGATLHHKLTVDIVNKTPYLYHPNEYYRPYVRLYVGDPASARLNNLRPPKYPSPAPPVGSRLLDGWLSTIRGYGGQGQAIFEYDTPWQADNTGQDQIFWQKQPGTLNDKVDVTWNDGSGHIYKVSGDLSQDRVITLTPSGVTLTPGQPAQAQLPSLSLG